jgi:hypothetical protein
MVGEVPRSQVKNVGGKKKGPNLGALIDTTIVGLFGLVATATAHEHWLKERDDVIPITEPLKAWVDQLPAKTLKKLEANLAPTLFVVGLATVIGPDAIAEVRLRAEEKRFKYPVSRTQQYGGFKADYVPPAGGNGAGAGGHNGSPSSAGGWTSSIPANPPVGSEFDV